MERGMHPIFSLNGTSIARCEIIDPTHAGGVWEELLLYGG